MSLQDWLAPARTALLLIDMQVDFAAPDGAMGRAGLDLTAVQAAVAQAGLLAAAARAAGVPCLFVRLITRAGDDSLREFHRRRGDAGPALCREGTRGADFVGPQPQGGELVFSKTRYDAFSGTGLDGALREMGRDTLLVCGLTTECCIEASVWQGFERGYHLFLAADAVGAYAPDLHAAALRALTAHCAAPVLAAQVLSAWTPPPA